MKKMNYTKNEKGFSFSQFAQCIMFAFIFGASSLMVLNGQTTVFSDDFTRASVSPGGSPSMIYTTTIGTGSGQTATIPANDFLNLQNSTVSGNIYVSGVTSSFSSFNSILSSNVGTVEWTFNSRYVRSTAASGLASGNYGYAVVLAGTNASFHNAGNGYAIVYGNSASPDPIRLVKYTNGLQGTLVDVINSTTANIADIRGYASVRVKYIPSSNSWSLYVRDDGTSAWVSVLSTPVPDVSQYGTTVVDNTYTTTGNTITNFGYFWNHAATTGQKSTFDNFKVTINIPVTWTSGWPIADTPTPTGFTAKANLNVAGKAYYVVVANGDATPSSAQVKAGLNNGGTAAIASGSITCALGATEYLAAISTLSGSTAYDVYYVAEDASGSNLQSTVSTVITVTTTASATAPLIQDPTVTAILINSATLGGNITSNGGATITDRGTVWSTITGVGIGDNKVDETGRTTGIFTQNRTSLPAKSKIYYKAYASNSAGTTLTTTEGNFYTLAVEPTTQVTGLTATAASTTSITLNWTAASDADGYFVLIRQSSLAPTGLPSDATVYSFGEVIGVGTVAAYVTSGSATSCTITGLAASTVYSFKVCSYNADGVNAGTYNYNTTSSPTILNKSTLTPPALSVSAGTLTGMKYELGSGPSTSLTYNVSGTNLVFPGDITITGSSSYEVSSDNSSFAGTASVPFTSATLSATPVYVRLKAGLSVGTYNLETVANTGGGAASAANVTCSGYVVSAPVTYTWIGSTDTSTDWQVSTNWSPTRTTPAVNDIVQFNNGISNTVTNVPTQAVAQLSITNNTTVELQSASAIILTINGAAGVDFDVQAGSVLKLAQATNAVTIAIATGATGSVAGSISFSTAAHKLTAADVSGITFESGGIFTANTGFSSNAFGTTGTANSVVFASGSKYISYAGANPFALNAPASIVVWQSGSTYVHKNTGAPGTANRTYANFELDAAATGINFTGSSPFTIDNLVVTSGSWGLGIKSTFTINGSISIASGATLNFNPTTDGTVQLKGDINVAAGGTIKFEPTLTESIVFSGTNPQSINNYGAFVNGVGSTISVTNANPLTLNGISGTNSADVSVTATTNASTLTNCTTCDITVSGSNAVLNINETKTVNSITATTGGKLEVTQPLTVSGAVVIEAGAKLDLSNTLTVTGDLTFKADESGSFSAKIGAGVTIDAASKLRYVKTMLDSKWYFMSFPCDVNINEITQVEGGAFALSNDWYIKYYNGQTRATNRGGTNWVEITNQNGILAANQGYIFGLKTGVGTKHLSFVLDKKLVASAEDAARPVAVKIWDATAGTHAGWNLVGQPFLSRFTGNKVTGATMVTIPDAITGRTYTQPDMSAATFEPFSAYFIQAGADESLSFDIAGRSFAPAATVATDLSDRVELNVTTATGTDFTNLIMDSNNSTAYEIGQDLEKWIGIGTAKPQVYSILGGINYAFNALPISNVVNLPIGFYTLTAGKSTISISNPSLAPSLSKLILTDKVTGYITDLLTSNYTFDATTGTDNSRFVITAQRVPTANLIETDADLNAPKLSIVNCQLSIENLSSNSSVRVFDAIGRMVANKTVSNNSLEIKLTAKGMYTVQIENGGKSWVKKIVF